MLKSSVKTAADEEERDDDDHSSSRLGVNSFALKENKGREKNKAPVLLGSGKGSWIVGVKRVKNIFAAAL